METDFPNQFYTAIYKRSLAKYTRRNIVYKLATRANQVLILSLSTTTPVIISLSSNAFSHDIAISLSTLVAILSGIGQIFRFETEWINAKTARNALEREDVMYRARLGIYADVPQADRAFMQAVQEIIDNYTRSHSARLQETFKAIVTAREKHG
jgi:hypothetical protein